MALTELDRVLFRIRDGDVTADELALARSLLRADARLPEELRGALDDDDDLVDSAVALLGVLGLDDGLLGELGAALMAEAGPETVAWDSLAAVLATPPEAFSPEALAADEADHPLAIAEAVAWEGGTVDVASTVCAQLRISALPVAHAVSGEAGRAEVAESVSDRLGFEELPVRAALQAEAGDVDVVASVFAALELDAAVPLAAALHAEAGTVEVAAQVLDAVGAETLPLAAAVRAEAGTADVATDVMTVVDPAWVSAMLDGELGSAQRLAAVRLAGDAAAGRWMTATADLGRSLREAVRIEAGPAPSVWGAVAAELGVEADAEAPFAEPIAEAVRAEAGRVDVTAEVMRSLRRSAAVSEAPTIPQPANARTWAWSGIAVAAVALIAIVAGRAVVGGSSSAPVAEVHTLEFAAADEITVDDLSYAEDVYVHIRHDDDPDAPLIIIVDDEVTL